MECSVGGHEFLSPYTFIEDFCARRGLVPANRIGTSETEKMCRDNAEEAREQYKTLRDAEMTADERIPAGSSERVFVAANENAQKEPAADIVPELSPEEKYQRRLHNNRKSAAATKVYNEVLRRDISTVIRLGEISDPQQFNVLCKRYAILQGGSENLFLENAKLTGKLVAAISEIEKLKQDLGKTRDMQVRSNMQLQSRSHASTLNSIVEYLGSAPHTNPVAQTSSESQANFQMDDLLH